MIINEMLRQNSLLKIYIEANVDKDFSVVSNDIDAFFIVNRTGKLVYVNKVFESLIGYSSPALLEMGLGDIFIPEQLNSSQTFFIEKNRKELANFDSQIIKKQGILLDVNVTSFPILFNHEEIGSYVVLKDMVKKKISEEREKHSYGLMEQSPETNFILKDNMIVDINPVGVSMFKAKNKEQLIGQSIYPVIHSEFVDIFKEKMNQVLIGNITDLFVQKMRRLDGELVDVEVKAFPTIFNGQLASHIIVRDISEKIKLSHISEKQAVAGQLAAGLAHEIRNPITAIKGFLQLMLGEYKGESMYLNIIESEIERIEIILNELMVLAKPTKLKNERLNIQHLLEQVLTLMESQALLNDIQVERHYNMANVLVLGDENQLKQVFINYIKNAMEAMPNGGKLLVEAISLNKSVLVRFIDQGNGNPPHILKRIGEPFFTTKENGTGLGMLVSSQIIQDHKGFIHIKTGKNGTCIEVEMPISN